MTVIVFVACGLVLSAFFVVVVAAMVSDIGGRGTALVLAAVSLLVLATLGFAWAGGHLTGAAS